MLCLAVYAVPVRAADVLNIEIPVSTEASGAVPSLAEKYNIRIEAENDAPLPEKTDIYTTGTGQTFFALDYNTPGIYYYTVYQTAGSNRLAHYDNAQYYVKVTVNNGQNGRLEAAAAVYRDRQMKGQKSEIVFINKYEKKKETSGKSGKNNSKGLPAQQNTSVQTAQKTVAVQSAKTSVKPKTGDDTPLLLWGSLLAITGIVLVILYTKLLKRKKK